MEAKSVDSILISLGLVVMVGYHLWLLYRVVRHPAATVIGINAINRRFWVQAMMQNPEKKGVLAVQTLRNKIMASTLLASTAIMLISVIAVLMTHSPTLSGDRSVNFFAILVCFMLAFLLNVQSIRYYSHASILINVPLKTRKIEPAAVSAVNLGGYFWSLGLRAFHFSLPLFFLVFGAVPMVVCCFVMVVILYFLDVNFGWSGEVEDECEQMEALHEEC